MSRTSFIIATSFLLAAINYGCQSPNTESDVGYTTGCEGAKPDDNGVCRRPDGRFAKKACCAIEATLPHPSTRRTLEAYTCPSEPSAEGVPVAFFDADSTLRIARSGQFTASEKDDVYILPFVASNVAQLSADGHLIAIVSNQGGVASGVTPFDVAEGALVFVASQLHVLGAKVDYLDFADQKDEFRKPKTGMADLLGDMLADKCGVGVDWQSSFMIGDAGYKKNVDGPHPDGRPADDFSNSDRLFAENLGIAFTEPNEQFGWRAWEVYNLAKPSDLFGLLDAIDAEIAALAESGDDPERHEMLAAEVKANRQINDLN
jgi:DNA 3'-phosphatase